MPVAAAAAAGESVVMGFVEAAAEVAEVESVEAASDEFAVAESVAVGPLVAVVGAEDVAELLRVDSEKPKGKSLYSHA